MGRESKITVNLEGFEKFKKELNKGYYAKVGILAGAKSARNGTGPLDNPTLGLIHEFGSVSANIPARSFLRMPLEMKAKQIISFLGSAGIKKKVEDADFKGVFAALGHQAENIIQEAFQTSGFGQWPPNTPATVNAKGSSAPLIDTGELRRSVTSTAVKKGGQ